MRQKTFPVIDPAATGANIVRLRRARGLSVRELQAFFGFEEPQAIYKWQKGKSLPSVDNLYALGALLEVPMEEILVSTDSKWNELVCEQQADACCSGLSISPPAKGFGGKDSVKWNRQGSLSRWIRQLFETFLKFQKVLQRVEKTFSTRWSSRQMPAALRILGGDLSSGRGYGRSLRLPQAIFRSAPRLSPGGSAGAALRHLPRRAAFVIRPSFPDGPGMEM